MASPLNATAIKFRSKATKELKLTVERKRRKKEKAEKQTPNNKTSVISLASTIFEIFWSFCFTHFCLCSSHSVACHLHIFPIDMRRSLCKFVRNVLCLHNSFEFISRLINNIAQYCLCKYMYGAYKACVCRKTEFFDMFFIFIFYVKR